MKICLKTNKVCPNNNKSCKVCKLKDCSEVLNMLEDYEELIKEKELKKELPKKCFGCSFLVVTDKNKVYCPYRIKDRCIIERK